MRRILARLFVALSVLTASGPAAAAWHTARSKHFVIYANENPKALAEFATRLEKFDQAVRLVRRMDDPPVGDGNRLEVFVVPNATTVQKLARDKTGFLAGYYSGRAAGPVAFVARKSGAGNSWDLTGNIIFFHEYAHHLMFQMFDRPLPEWVVEGFAEFMSTARFEKDGGVGLGAPAQHRAWSLFQGESLPLESLLGGTYSKITPEQRESIYSRGWLLVHYLTFEGSRKGQLERYADQIGKGVAPLVAARTAFGDLGQLDRDLKAYLNRRTISYLKLPPLRLQAGKIEVEPLSEGAAQVIMLRAASKAGVDDKTAEPLAAQIRAVQVRYPGDQLVEVTLAEAELDAGHLDAAEAAAERALRANPRNTEALVLKGRATADRAEKMDANSARALFEQARKTFVAANKIDPEDPEPLMEFYRAYVREGIQPTANAIAALHYASTLAPQDLGLRMNSAMRFLVDGKLPEARRALAPIAYDPHGRALAQVARQILTRIDAGDSQGAMRAAQSGPSEPQSSPD